MDRRFSALKGIQSLMGTLNFVRLSLSLGEARSCNGYKIFLWDYKISHHHVILTKIMKRKDNKSDKITVLSMITEVTISNEFSHFLTSDTITFVLFNLTPAVRLWSATHLLQQGWQIGTSGFESWLPAELLHFASIFVTFFGVTYTFSIFPLLIMSLDQRWCYTLLYWPVIKLMTQTAELETNTKEGKLCRNKEKFNKPSSSFQAVLDSDVPAGSSEFLP